MDIGNNSKNKVKFRNLKKKTKSFRELQTTY